MKNILLGIGWLLILTPGAQAGAEKTPSAGQYVNMGSSFAAGTGIEPVVQGSVPRCRQSESGYASLLAKRLGMVLDDRSCAGASSIHLLEPWKELPAQMEAVNSQTRLVTITVGGNDLSYVRNLMAAGCVAQEGFNFAGKVVPCFEETAVSETQFAQLEANLLRISRQISLRAPESKIVFIQYVALLPGELCEATPLTEEEASRLRNVGRRLSEITASVAKESGALLLSMDVLSAGHTACDEEPWSIGAMVTANNDQGMPWHPNRRASEIIAAQLQRILAL